MSKDLVIFGPWCGEFSYEFQWWVPEIRKRRNTEFKDFDAIHVGYFGRSFLYDDFIDEYISYPHDVESVLSFPSAWAQVLNPNRKSIVAIPHKVVEFVDDEISNSFVKKYDTIILYKPKDMISTIYKDLPYGEYIHYDAKYGALKRIQDKLDFDNPYRKKVLIMARARTRNGIKDADDWNPKHWEIFIDLIIRNLDLNVCILDIPQKDSNGGSLSFRDTETYNNHINNMKIIDFDNNKDSVEEQIALLQLVDCAIYGASGSAILPYFTKTPVFTQQAKENGYRHKFQWHRNLTNNLKNVCVVDSHSQVDIYDMSPVELFEKFKIFWENLSFN
jgi:hypothetical protein